MITIEARYWLDPTVAIPANTNALEHHDGVLLVNDWDGALVAQVGINLEGVDLAGAMRTGLARIGLVLEEFYAGGQQAIPHQVVLVDVERAMRPRELVAA